MGHIRRYVLHRKVLLAVAALLAALSLASVFDLLSRQPEIGSAEPEPIRTSPSGPKPEPPNIVLILTDDMRYDDLRFMPKTRALLARQGLSFERAYVTDSVCCPSRATILRGQYAHNHRVLTNKPPEGSVLKFNRLGRDKSTVATWLQDAGYKTALFGNYLKQYNGTYVPPGWSEWYGWSGENRFSENGKLATRSPDKHLTDALAEMSEEYIRRSDEPFFLYTATTAPHPPAKPPRRYAEDFQNLKAPRDASFNERRVSDKPEWVRDNPPMTEKEISEIDELYRNRARSLRAVDDMVERLVDALAETGKLENTYVVFTSDNGFHMGEHRLPPMKQTAYEEDIRVPLLVRGPGVPAGETRDQIVLNNDFAPTFAEWAGTEVPDFVDGRSLTPLLSHTPPNAWRTAFLVEKWGEQAMKDDYKAVRTRNRLYVKYSNDDRELYDTRRDPQQLRNLYHSASPRLLKNLAARLDDLKSCRGNGAGSCYSAEQRGSPTR